MIYLARRRLLEGHTNVRQGLPSDTTFSQRTAGIESKVEFAGKIRGALKLQAGTVIAQITDNTTDGRPASQNEGGGLVYYCPWKAPTLKHGKTNNSMKITAVHICFPMGNRIAGAVLICANPTSLYTKELAIDLHRMVALGITKQLLARVLMRNNHLRLSRVPLIA